MAETRSGIIETVTTPLAFMTLGLLAAEGTIFSFLNTQGIDKNYIVAWSSGVFLVFILLVVGLAVWRPEALTGNRPLQQEHAKNMAGSIFFAFEGVIRNNTESEQLEAWRTSSAALLPEEGDNSTYADFSRMVSVELRKKYQIRFKVED